MLTKCVTLRTTVLGVAVCLVAACSTTEPTPPPELVVTEFAVDGVSQSDFAAGQAVIQQATQDCLRAKGFTVTLPAPRLLDANPVTGEGPVTVAINSSHIPSPYQLGVDPRLAASTPGLVEASQSCWNESLQAQYQRMGAVKAIGDRLTAEWQQYSTGADYRRAVGEFSSCMNAAGYPATSPEDAGSALQSAVDLAIGAANDNNAPPDAADIEATLAPLKPQEDAIRQAGRTCWNEHLKKPLTDYRAGLWQKYPDDLVKYTKAVRNEA